MKMRTGWLVLTVSLGVMGCGGSVEEADKQTPSSLVTEIVTVPAAARTKVQAACKGSHDRAGSCVACVARAAESLRQAGTITANQKGPLIASFAVKECHDRCVPTTCDIEGSSCGTASDLCGHPLDCGTCPAGQTCSGSLCVTAPPSATDLVACFCGDGSEIRICADVDCDSNAEKDAICGPACDSPHGGEVFTECFVTDPNCTSP